MISDGALHRFNKDVLYREGKKNCVRSYDEEQKLIGTKIRPPASSWGRHFFVKTTKKFFCIKTLQECRWLLLPPALRLLLLLYWPFTLQSPFLIRYRYLSLSLSLSLLELFECFYPSQSISFYIYRTTFVNSTNCFEIFMYVPYCSSMHCYATAYLITWSLFYMIFYHPQPIL